MSVMRKSDSELELDSTYNTPSITRLSSLSPSRQNSLQVENTVVALVHSLPDLSLVGPPRSARRSPSPISASEQLYKSHQELLKSRLNVQSQSRAGRGSSYLLSSPIGSSLRKGLAFSSSFQRPSLLGTGHVASQGNIDKVQSEPHTISIPVPRKMPSQTPSQEPTAGPSKEKDDSSRSVAKFLQGGYSQEELEKMRKQDEIAKLKAERLRNAHKARTRYLRQAARNA
ncbi:uncharacterized protein [Epargyreus clarus]|uniref:uncharacterized protein n=1 Tax=Epargyreus clarus TaxID=520877 RepID=UPI003C2B6286